MFHVIPEWRTFNPITISRRGVQEDTITIAWDFLSTFYLVNIDSMQVCCEKALAAN